MNSKFNNRILIVDDNKSIHEDFNKVLCPKQNNIQSELGTLEEELFEEDFNKENRNTQITYEVDSSYQGKEALKMVIKSHEQGNPYALIFMDVRMPPGWDGVETIMRIWLKYPYTEIVLCSAYSDYSWDDIINKLGATDMLLFLRKPFESIAVQQMALSLVKKWNLGNGARHQVINLEREVQERTKQLEKLLKEVDYKNQELANMNKELENVALHDSLTQLPNRFLFNNRLEHSIKMASRYQNSFGLLIIDLDNFKQINDTMGHPAGDKILQEVSKRFKLSLRKSDTVARLGGDEFAIILPAETKEGVLVVAKKITEALHAPIILPNTSIYSNGSIGIALFPEHGDDDITLMKHADIAMYQAKESNVNFFVFDPERNSIKIQEAEFLSDLKGAILNKKLTLHYQPIWDIVTRKIYSVEALSRWNHPEKGLIFPDKFISLAEQKGLILDLTLWVFDVAFKQCVEWHKMGQKIHISINISSRHFTDPLLPDKVEKYLNKWNLAPEWVILEVTENITIKDNVQTLSILDKLKKMGVHIAIDDFGIGYSSLSYLRKMPLDELKIDLSFIKNIMENNDNKVIVQSIISLAHSLEINVVAEGVENENILNFLKTISCDKGQGFHICKPKPAEEISQWLVEYEEKLKK